MSAHPSAGRRPTLDDPDIQPELDQLCDELVALLARCWAERQADEPEPVPPESVPTEVRS